MGNKIKSLNDELQDSKNDPDVEDNSEVVVESVTAKETNSVEAENTDKNNHWIYCELYIHKCKTDKTMKKNMETKHKNKVLWDVCDKMF